MTLGTAGIELVGRSSSHFTRVTRIFALELGVPHHFRPLLDLTVTDTDAYAGNPALKIPVLVDEHGSLFGTENICRALLRHSGKPAATIVLRGDLQDRGLANAEELTLHAMSSGVALIMAKAASQGQPAPPKITTSLQQCLRHLDETLETTLSALPANRLLSFFEVTLFCLVTHLEFRELADTSSLAQLGEFCRQFGERESAKATTYRFDK